MRAIRSRSFNCDQPGRLCRAFRCAEETSSVRASCLPQTLMIADVAAIDHDPHRLAVEVEGRREPGRLSKVQSVDQQMCLGMRCLLSLSADVPSHTSGAADIIRTPNSNISIDQA